MEDYRTIRGTAVGEYEEKKSRFIAQLSFADSEEAAVAFLEQVRAANRTARHNVYAYRLREGNRERYSDDGEPAKTAGTPALEVLQHSGLTDLIVVITRYFGGGLLGTGGVGGAGTPAAASFCTAGAASGRTFGVKSSSESCCVPTANALGSSSAAAISCRVPWAAARPLQVIKYWARFSTTPIRLSSAIPRCCWRRADKIRNALCCQGIISDTS